MLITCRVKKCTVISMQCILCWKISFCRSYFFINPERIQTISTISNAPVTEKHQMNRHRDLYVLETDRRADRQTDRQTDREWGGCCCCCCSGNPSPRSSFCARRAAGRYLCALSSCHRLRWFTRADTRRRVSDRPTPSSPGRPKSRLAAGQPGSHDPLLQLRQDGQDRGLPRASKCEKIDLLFL